MKTEQPQNRYIALFTFFSMLGMSACLTSSSEDDGEFQGTLSPLVVQTVYTEDFESNAGSEWSLATINSAHMSTLTKFSGRFSNHSQILTLDLPPGDYELRFDFYQFDTWDGGANDCVSSWTGPDRFRVTANSVTVFDEIFSRWGRSRCQSYFPLAPLEHLGGGSTSDARYRLTVPVTNESSNLAIDFRGVGLQSIADESWGIDNIEIVQFTRDEEPNCHTGEPGDRSYCSEACPCDEGEGDCDDDTEQCAAGLTCVHNVGANYGWEPDVDVCEATCHSSAPGAGNYCSEECPCDAGEGDCDGDTEQCAPGLTCVHNVGANYGWDSDVDVCESTYLVASSCLAIWESDNLSETGIYVIDPDGSGGIDAFDVYCDMTSDGGGWTLVAYHSGVQQTYLRGSYHPTNESTSPVEPTFGYERSINPNLRGIVYDEIAFYTDDTLWAGNDRSYIGFWVGDFSDSNYDIMSNECQLLRPTAPGMWNGELVYNAGDNTVGPGCTGGGSVFTSPTQNHCDDGGGCVVTNNTWPMNGGDALWGWNYVIWSHSFGDSYQSGPIVSEGLYMFLVR